MQQSWVGVYMCVNIAGKERFTNSNCDGDPELCMFLHGYCHTQACMQVVVFEVFTTGHLQPQGGGEMVSSQTIWPLDLTA